MHIDLKIGFFRKAFFTGCNKLSATVPENKGHFIIKVPDDMDMQAVINRIGVNGDQVMIGISRFLANNRIDCL